MLRWLLNLIKIGVCGILYGIGLMGGGMVAQAIGLATPAIPRGVDPSNLFQLMLAIGLLLCIALSFLSTRLATGFLSRWLILSVMAVIANGVNTALEASIFSTDQATGIYSLFTGLFSSVLCAGGAALFFRPKTQPGEEPALKFSGLIRRFFSGRSTGEWAARLFGAFLSFPAAYFIFGMIVSPYVIQYYQQNYSGLALPTWGQMLPMAALRSLLFLAACLLVLIAWKGSRTSLFLALGGTLFILVGGAYMVIAYWLPPVIRVAHSLEILADSYAHAAALVYLLVQAREVNVSIMEAEPVAG